MATCYTPSDRTLSDELVPEGTRYVIADASGTAWTDTAFATRGRDVCDALQAAGHGHFEMIDGRTGLVHYTTRP